MSNDSNRTHPVKRDGISQVQRKLPAFDPAKVRIDDRNTSDLLNFIYRFSRQVNYYGPQLEKDDWTGFFIDSLPVRIALVGKFDLGAVDKEKSEIEAGLSDLADFPQLNLLTDLVLKLAFEIHDWHNERFRDDESGFRLVIRQLITRELKPIIRELIGFVKGAGQWGYCPRRNLSGFLDNAVWGLSPTDLFYLPPAFLRIKGRKKKRIILYQRLLNEWYRIFFKALSGVVQKAPDFLEKSLTVQEAHQPHLGLLFAFLRLFATSQGQLNELSRRHLDFFYRKVLQLKEASAEPDHAYLVFELAQNLKDKLLAKHMAFSAGQDVNGADLIYTLDDDIVLTPAKLVSLRTLHIDQEPKEPPMECGGNTDYKLQGIYAAPLAQMADGIKTPFPDPLTAGWPTVGDRFSRLESATGADLYQPYPDALLGLVVASPVLLLQEGRRCIELTLTADLDLTGEIAPPDLLGVQGALKAAVMTRYLIRRDLIPIMEEAGLQTDGVSKLESFLSDGNDEREASQSAFQSLLDSITAQADRQIVFQYAIRRHPFKVSLSGANGWIYPYDVRMDWEFVPAASGMPNKALLKLWINLDATQDPVTFPKADLLGAEFGTPYPLIRLELDHSIKVTTGTGPNQEECALYHFWRFLRLVESHIDVTVCGVRNLILQNDTAVQDPNKPVLPFGAVPKLGANFYIGSKEVFCKNWKEVWINYDWVIKPTATDLMQIYQVYATGTFTIDSVTVLPHLLEAKNWQPYNHGGELDIAIFDPPIQHSKPSTPKNCPSLSQNQVIGISKSHDFVGSSTVPASRIFDPQKPFSINSQYGFLRLELNPDKQSLLHEQYETVLRRQADALANLALPTPLPVNNAIYFDPFIGYQKYPDDYVDVADFQAHAPHLRVDLPNPPFVPTIAEIYLDYTAGAKTPNIDLVHLYPYAQTYLPIEIGTASKPTLLPAFTDEGSLYIGLGMLTPGSNLHVLFQMAESTADPYLSQAAVEWHYLKDNKWEKLLPDIGVISDGTNGLIQSGIVKLAIPKDITSNNTILPAGSFWLRVIAPERAKAVAETVAIHLHAASVSFQPSDKNDLQRLSADLPAGTIANPVIGLAALQSMQQPYAGFGGRPPETASAYDVRISEHLRHKGRAITIFDYERLTLQAFPEIFKAKCISHTLGRKLNGLAALEDPEIDFEDIDLEQAPGFVTLAVIPDLSKLPVADRLRPRLSTATLEKVYDFLKARISPFVCLRVLNPIFEEVSVTVEVRFQPGKSVDFYKKQLQQDLVEFLSPWAFHPDEEVVFGGRIYNSAILQFIEERSYVDYLRDLVVKDYKGEIREEYVEARTARSILVSGKHEVSSIDAKCCVTGENKNRIKGSGIGFMTVGASSGS